MNIIELAKEAGLLSEGERWVSPHKEHMEHFAALVRAEALEEAAKVCDQRTAEPGWCCADAIRGMK